MSLGTSLWLTSAPELVAATGDEGNPKAGSHEGKDTLDLLPVGCAIQANIMAIDPLSQPSLPSATDTAIMGSSQWELDARHACYMSMAHIAQLEQVLDGG
jgi:hypothetical protein